MLSTAVSKRGLRSLVSVAVFLTVALATVPENGSSDQAPRSTFRNLVTKALTPSESLEEKRPKRGKKEEKRKRGKEEEREEGERVSYLVLARKWRPGLFGDLVGQGHVARTLENAIRQDRVAHAYLFAGPRGVGKTSTARILAAALNCEKGPTPEPCGECGPCQEIGRASCRERV